MYKNQEDSSEVVSTLYGNAHRTQNQNPPKTNEKETLKLRTTTTTRHKDLLNQGKLNAHTYEYT